MKNRKPIPKTRGLEQALKKSEAEYRQLIELVNSIIIRVDITGRVTFINEYGQKFFGYQKEDIIGKDIIDTIMPEVESSGRNLIELLEDTLLYPERHIIDENEHIRMNGTRVWVLWTNKAILDDSGQPTEFLCIGTDITARKNAENALQELNDELEKKVQERTENLKKAYDDLSRVMDGTTHALSKAIEIRDPYTSGHQKRVTQLAIAIAREMGLGDDTLKAIEIAGLLHDLGKIYVPAEFLSRPGRISQNELGVLRDHSQAGYEILKDIEYQHPIAAIVLQHHERMDGSGYPNRLPGDQILLEARIIGIADVVESMASHRPYRLPLGIANALNEIETNKGILYDEAIVDACLRLFQEKGFKLELP